MKKIAMIGFGGHGKVVLDTLKCMNYEVVKIYDDNLEGSGIKDLKYNKDLQYICAIGDNQARKTIIEKSDIPEESWAIAIHPSAVVSKSAVIGPGSLICAGVIIQPNTLIGKHCIINTNTSIDHDCRIADYCHIAPGCTLCGSIEVGINTFIGAGCTVINKKKIGNNVILGAGSLVIRDIPDNCKAYGTPSKVIGQIL